MFESLGTQNSRGGKKTSSSLCREGEGELGEILIKTRLVTACLNGAEITQRVDIIKAFAGYGGHCDSVSSVMRNTCPTLEGCGCRAR